MRPRTTMAALGTATVLLGFGLAGCGTDSGTKATSSEPAVTSSTAGAPVAAPSSSAQVQGPAYTIADYARDNGITQSMVKRNAPGAPQFDLPVPVGWVDVSGGAPDVSWGVVVPKDALNDDDAPSIIARMGRLSGGKVDQAKILELAPNKVRNMPGYQGADIGQRGTVSGFKSAQIAGTIVHQGQPVFVVRETVVIPGRDGTYLLALDAQGAPDQQDVILKAMSAIDAESRIVP